MNLYLISQDTNRGYDTYDSAVVVARSESEARKIHPDGVTKLPDDGEMPDPDKYWELSSWVADPLNVSVQFIGVAAKDLTEGSVVCASFNSG